MIDSRRVRSMVSVLLEDDPDLLGIIGLPTAILRPANTLFAPQRQQPPPMRQVQGIIELVSNILVFMDTDYHNLERAKQDIVRITFVALLFMCDERLASLVGVRAMEGLEGESI